jgi:carbon-monoxide dehydrogenase large subunit
MLGLPEQIGGGDHHPAPKVRPNLQRLTQGRATYVSGVALPCMAHAAFLRSPHAHAAITRTDLAVAMVVAATRAQAEDAAERIEIEFAPLPPVVDVLAPLDPAALPIHPELGAACVLKPAAAKIWSA